MMHEIEIYENDADLLHKAMRQALRENDYPKAWEILRKWAEPLFEPYQRISNKMRYVLNISGSYGRYHDVWYKYILFFHEWAEPKLGGRAKSFFVDVMAKALENPGAWLDPEPFGRIIYDDTETHRKVNTLANAHVFHLGLDGGIYPGRNFPDLIPIPENLKELPENVR